MTQSRSHRPPIIALALTPWHGAWMNRQQLLSRLAKRSWPVIYSTGALSVWDRGKPLWNQAGWQGGFETAGDVMLDRPGRLSARWPRLEFWDRWMVDNHAKRMARAARELGTGDSIALVFHPACWPYVKNLGARYLVYYAYDIFALAPGWTPELEDMQRELAAGADLIVASSDMVVPHLAVPKPGKVKVLLNGADSHAFEQGAKSACPADLAAIPHPRIGYVGNLTPKVDFTSVAEVARRRPDWHWVFVGPATAVESDAEIKAGYAACKQLGNVHFLGPKHFTELPAYVNHMDVNTMCYRLQGGWWVAGYPLKLHEYLAAGRPVVSIDMESIRPLADVIDFVTTPDGWIAAIQRALSTGGVGTPRTRRAVAAQNTWDSRVDQLEAWLLEMTACA